MSTSSFNAIYALGAIAETLLAASGSVTCVVVGDESILSSCVAHILANVDIEHPVGHVINSALQCHHDNHHSSTKSLLVMTSLWLREMDCLVQQGVPLDAVLSDFHQAIEQCVQQLQDSKTAVEDVLKSFKPTQSVCTDGHNSGRILDNSSDDVLQSHNAGQMLDPSSDDILQSHNAGRMPDDSSDDILQSHNSGRMPDDSSDDPIQSHISGSMTDDSSVDPVRSHSCGRKLNNSSGDRSNGQEQQQVVTSNTARKNVMPAILPQGHGDIEDEDDDISWYFEGSNLNLSDDETLEIMMNAMGDMQEKLGGFTDFGSNSYMDRSCGVSHGPSGDMFSTVSNGMTLLSGEDKGVTHDILSSCEVKTECQLNSARVPKEPLMCDKETKMAAVMEELSRTSQLLVRCTRTVSSADANISNVTHSESNKGSNDLNVGCNTGSVSHPDTGSTAQGSGSTYTSHGTGTQISTHVDDSDDEFSSCFDGVVNHQDDVECSKQLEGTSVPSSGHLVSAGLSLESLCQDMRALAEKSTTVNDVCVLNGSRHFRTCQSMHSAGTTQEGCGGGTGEIMSLKSPCHLLKSSKNSATSEGKTLHVTPPMEEMAIRTSECDTRQTSQSGCSYSNGNLEVTSLHDTTSKSRLENVSSTKTGLIQNDIQHKVSRFIHCLRPDCGDVLDALTETVVRQMTSDQFTDKDENLRFDMSRVHAVTAVGPMRWDVIDGLVVETDGEQLGLLSGDNSTRRVLLINGDVSSGFHHKGFTEKTKTRFVSKTLTGDSRNVSWLDDICVVLRELGVGALLVHGSVSGEVREMCYARRIVVLDRVPYKVVQGVAESCLREPTVYVSEATQDNVADDVIIRPWSCDWMDHLLTPVSYALVQPNISLVQTVMISHPCGNVGAMKEETFWHCAHRLHNMLVDGAVLPGGGATEQACAVMLRSRKSSEHVDERNVFSSLVCEHVAMGLETFTQLVQRNSLLSATDQSDRAASDTEGATIYDCLRAKQDGWRTAEYLVGVVITADMEVVTGVDKNYVRAEGDVLGHL